MRGHGIRMINSQPIQLSSRNRYYWVDWLRFISAFTVLLVHSRGTVFSSYGELLQEDKNLVILIFYFLTRIGDEAVIVFFVLSGFLVGGKLIEKAQNNTLDINLYIVDRSVRILLPLAPALLLTLIINHTRNLDIEPDTFILNLLSLQGVATHVYGGNAPLWSLAYEVWFYILAGAMYTYYKNPNILTLCLIIFTLSLCAKLQSIYLFCWLIGALVFNLRNISHKISILSYLSVFYAILCIQLGSNSMSLPTKVQQLSYFILPIEYARILLSFGMAIIIKRIINIRPSKKLTLELEDFGTTLASLSYTLYLTHYPILMWYRDIAEPFRTINLKTILIYITINIICLLIAWIMWYFFERHTAQVKRLLHQRLKPNIKLTRLKN